MKTIQNIRPKSYKRDGVTYESTFDQQNTYHADITPGASIRIYGTYRNHVKGPQEFDKTFKVGDWAEYNSYNLSYCGPIVAIGPKTITVKHYEHSEQVSRLDLHTFCWRNWDYDQEKIAKRNQEEMACL